MVRNFPLSLLIFKANFSLSADDLALLTVKTLSTKPYLVLIHPKFFSKFSTHNVFLGPEFCTQTPKQHCDFGTLAAADTSKVAKQNGQVMMSEIRSLIAPVRAAPGNVRRRGLDSCIFNQLPALGDGRPAVTARLTFIGPPTAHVCDVTGCL